MNIAHHGFCGLDFLFLSTVYIHLLSNLKTQHFAPLAPQFWRKQDSQKSLDSGEMDSQSPSELGNLGGKKDLGVHRSLQEEETGIKVPFLMGI